LRIFSNYHQSRRDIKGTNKVENERIQPQKMTFFQTDVFPKRSDIFKIPSRSSLCKADVAMEKTGDKITFNTRSEDRKSDHANSALFFRKCSRTSKNSEYIRRNLMVYEIYFQIE
jgi:hypothetical protein